ncbi:MAG TPA: patatin-like phospholipase family protein [Bacteroidales bacterium]|nr:patatin-like phospholipase family protein [Bacteroidales bacterium]
MISHLKANDPASFKAIMIGCLTLILSVSSALASVEGDSLNIAKRPSLGLVLSGGGAKGFAHVGVLKVLHEAGLDFDYVGGTSMGSIIGSMFALRYHPDTIASIIRAQDWDATINDRIPRAFIPIEEKQNADRFIITFPIVERKVKVKQGLVAGQMVDLLLAKYLSPAYKFTSFDQLPVPFLCVATNLEDGTDVVLKNGVLHRAVRASMSIPSFFNPVTIDGRLLVDGGVINNFPVQEAINAGADYIIGVDVQTGLYSAERLNSMFAILDQVISFYRQSANKRAVSLTDIYIKPDVSAFDMMSFSDYEQIMQRGEEAARQFLPELKRLADSLNRLEPRKPAILDGRPLDSIFITSIQYNGLKGVSKEFLDGIIEVHPRSWVKLNLLTENLKRAYGSGFFEHISYHFITTEEGAGLVIDIREAGSGIIGAGIHYDTDYKAALLLNTTFKNAGLKGSKLFIDLNLGENPRLQGLYLVDRGARTGFGLRSNFYNLKLNKYFKKDIFDIHRINQASIEGFAQWTFANTYRLRIGSMFEKIRIRSSFTDIGIYGYHDYLVNFIDWSKDSYNKNQFATSGSKVNLHIRHIRRLSSIPGSLVTPDAVIFSARYNTNIPINKENTFKYGLVGGFTVNGHRPPPQHRFILGGQSHQSTYGSFIPFTGLRFIENNGLYTLNASMQWQYRFAPKFYATPRFDVGFITETIDQFKQGPSVIAGYGATLGWESVIGPFELSLMASNNGGGAISFINIGYWF